MLGKWWSDALQKIKGYLGSIEHNAVYAENATTDKHWRVKNMTEQEMLKEALEWQEHIRKLITATDDELYHKRSKVFDWLINTVEQQVEKVEQLQQENERLKKFLNWEQEEAQGLDEEVTFQLEQLKQAQAKAERYEKALEFYANKCHMNYLIETGEWDGEDGMIARQALGWEEEK